MSKRPWFAGVPLLLVAGCSTGATASSGAVDVTPKSATPVSTGAPTTPPPSASVRTPIAPPSGTAAPDIGQWACEKRADCTQTCALGAVSLAWLKAHRDADTCDDGCGWKSTEVDCREGKCVTTNPDGSVNDACSFKPYPPPKKP